MSGPVTQFIERHFRHFNAAALNDAADGYIRHLDRGGHMLVTLAGAMSTAELGISLAEMIRRDKVQLICCTGANLEEDLFNLVAHDHYVRVPRYRDLTPADEQALLERHLNRVTDTCIPEFEAMRRIEGIVIERWVAAAKARQRRFPHEFLYEILRDGSLKQLYQIDPADSWMLAAAERNLPVFVPGWEDSTLGNVFAARCMDGRIADITTIEVRASNTWSIWRDCYTRRQRRALDRVLPDRRRHRRRLSDLRRADAAPGPADGPTCRSGATSARSATRRRATARIRARCRTRRSRGASSAPDTPSFVIESDATIVAPLLFAKVLGW